MWRTNPMSTRRRHVFAGLLDTFSHNYFSAIRYHIMQTPSAANTHNSDKSTYSYSTTATDLFFYELLCQKMKRRCHDDIHSGDDDTTKRRVVESNSITAPPSTQDSNDSSVDFDPDIMGNHRPPFRSTQDSNDSSVDFDPDIVATTGGGRDAATAAAAPSFRSTQDSNDSSVDFDPDIVATTGGRQDAATAAAAPSFSQGSSHSGDSNAFFDPSMDSFAQYKEKNAGRYPEITPQSFLKQLREECLRPDGVFRDFGMVLYNYLTDRKYDAFEHLRRGLCLIHLSLFGPHDLRAVELVDGEPRRYDANEVRKVQPGDINPHRRGALQPCSFLYDIWSNHDLGGRSSGHKRKPKRNTETWASTNIEDGLYMFLETKCMDLVPNPQDDESIRQRIIEALNKGFYESDDIAELLTELTDNVEQHSGLTARLQRFNLCDRIRQSWFEFKEGYIYLYTKEMPGDVYNCETEGENGKTLDELSGLGVDVDRTSPHYMMWSPATPLFPKTVRSSSWTQPNAFIRFTIDDNNKIHFSPVTKNPYFRANRTTPGASSCNAEAEQVVTSLPI